MDRTKDLETWNENIQSQKISSIAVFCNQFLLQNDLFPWVFSEFIHKIKYVDSDTVIQLFIKRRNLFMYQNYRKFNTRAMNTSEDLTMTMICGFTIRIGKYHPQLLL